MKKNRRYQIYRFFKLAEEEVPFDLDIYNKIKEYMSDLSISGNTPEEIFLEEEEISPDLQGSVSFGDSQIKGQLGRKLSATNSFGYVGYSIKRLKKVLEASKDSKGSLFESIKDSKKIYLSAGGNPSNVPKLRVLGSAMDLIDLILSINPRIKIVWITPIPPSFDGSGRGLGTDLKGEAFYKSRVEERKGRGEEIKSLESSYPNLFVINSYNHIREGGRPGYSCSSCDGIHATSSVASKLAAIAKGV